MNTLRPPTCAALLLAGCLSDYGIEPREGVNPPGLDTGALELGPPDTGAVGYAMCLDPEVTTEVATDESCDTDRVEGSLAATIEWEVPRFEGYDEYSQVVMAPVVGQLDDDNGDGVIDRRDTPDIVVVSDDEGVRPHRKGVLRRLNGDGTPGAPFAFRIDVEDAQIYPYRYSNLALGDIDRDGLPEIVGIVEIVGGNFGGDEGGPGDDPPPSDDGGGEDGGGSGDVPVRPSMQDGGSGGTGAPEGSEAADFDADDGGTGFLSEPPPVCFVAAFTADLELEWAAGEVPLPCGGHAPALADLTGDGDVEVILGDHVFDGGTGELEWIGGAGKGAFPTHPEVGYHAIPMDLDRDGRMELLTGQTIYDADGDVRCGWEDEGFDGFVAAADFNDDDVGEVVAVGGGNVRIFDTRCGVVAEWPLSGGGNGGPPTVSDFDADGDPEIGVADASTYSVYEGDGRLLWSMPVKDESSHVTGSVVFDFDADGRTEVVYADETRLWIFDGATGEVRLEDDHHASRTLHDFPTVADVDGDGETEIVVPNGGGHGGENNNGLYVLGGAEGGWAPSRQVWNQHGYSITNINDDLSIPSPAAPNWPTWNNFRSGDVNPTGQGRTPDAVPLAEVCLDECVHGRIIAMVRVGNAGANTMRSGLPVSVYAEDEQGTRTLLETAWVTEIVPDGLSSAAIRVALDAADVEGKSLVFVADDDDGVQYVAECSEDNNELVIEGALCP